MTMIWAVLAFFLSLIAPGGAQVLNGQYFKAFLFAFVFVFGRYVLLPLALRVCDFGDMARALKMIYIFNLVYPAVIILSAVDGVFVALRGAAPAGRAALWAICAALVISTMYKGMGARFIVLSMLGRKQADLLPFILPRKKDK